MVRRSFGYLLASSVLIVMFALDLIVIASGQSGQSTSAFIYELTQRLPDISGNVVPVLSLIVASMAFSSDRREGSMRLLLTHGVTDLEYLTGKLTGSLIAILAPLIIGFLMYFAFGATLTGVEVTPTVGAVFFLTLLNTMLLASAFSFLGSFISVATDRPSSSVLVGILLFFLLGPVYFLVAFLGANLAMGVTPGNAGNQVLLFAQVLKNFESYSPVNALVFIQSSFTNSRNVWAAVAENLAYYGVLFAWAVAAFLASFAVFLRREK